MPPASMVSVRDLSDILAGRCAAGVFKDAGLRLKIVCCALKPLDQETPRTGRFAGHERETQLTVKYSPRHRRLPAAKNGVQQGGD